jgi:hypothetical protein
MRNVAHSSTLGRVIAGFAMGSLTFALIGLSAALGPIGVTAVLHSLAQLIFPLAAIAAALIAALSSSARRAWGRSCLMNGVVSIALGGATIEVGQPLWPADPVYERALDQGVQWWLKHMVWTTAAYFAAAMIIAAALFALSYWLLHSSHGRHRQAH